jgi:hypothetical protein
MLARKFLAVGATALVSAGLFASSAHGSGAAKADVSKDHVTCNTLFGTVGFAPPLTSKTPNVPAKIIVKGTVDGCTDTDNANVHLVASSFSGVLNAKSNSITALLGLTSVTGNLTIKWKVDKTSAPLMQTMTVTTPNAMCGSTYSAGAPLTGTYGFFHIGGPKACMGQTQPASTTAAGSAFAGTDGGASSTTDAATSQDIGALINAAGTGIKSINLGLGQITLG